MNYDMTLIKMAFKAARLTLCQILKEGGYGIPSCGSWNLCFCHSAVPVLFLFYFPSGKKLGFTIDNGKLHNVSLGQGQEVVAENALDMAAENGHWVILQVRGRGCPCPWGGAPPGPQHPRRLA